MTDIDDIKKAIAETNVSLNQKVKILETNVKETAGSIKETIEQGAAGVRHVTDAFSPLVQVRQHPVLVTSAMLGLGLYLGSRSSRKSIKDEKEERDATERPIAPSPSKTHAIIEPVAIGLFTALAGEVFKKYMPKLEDQTSSIQSAIVKEMTSRVLREFR